MHFRYFVELDGGPEQGSKRYLADLTKVKLSLRRRLVRSRSKWNVEVLVFDERKKTGVLGEKPLGVKERSNNKLNPYMASIPRLEPRSYYWEAVALITAPHLLPNNNLLCNLCKFYP